MNFHLRLFNSNFSFVWLCSCGKMERFVSIGAILVLITSGCYSAEIKHSSNDDCPSCLFGVKAMIDVPGSSVLGEKIHSQEIPENVDLEVEQKNKIVMEEVSARSHILVKRDEKRNTSDTENTTSTMETSEQFTPNVDSENNSTTETPSEQDTSVNEFTTNTTETTSVWDTTDIESTTAATETTSVWDTTDIESTTATTKTTSIHITDSESTTITPEITSIRYTIEHITSTNGTISVTEDEMNSTATMSTDEKNMERNTAITTGTENPQEITIYVTIKPFPGTSAENGTEMINVEIDTTEFRGNDTLTTENEESTEGQHKKIDDGKQKRKLGPATIGGIVISALMILTAVTAGIFICHKYRWSRGQEDSIALVERSHRRYLFE